MPDTDDLSFSGGPDTLIPALDGDPTPDSAAEPDIPALNDEPTSTSTLTSDTPEEAAQTDGDGASEAAIADDDPLLLQYAKRTGLDPSDPNQRKTLETIVNKEKYIQQLKAGMAPAAAQADQPQSLTKFEQEQLQAEQNAQAQQTQASEAPKMPTLGQYNDIGAQWQSPNDGYQALSQAWAHAQETGDMRPVIQTEAALYERRFDAIGMPKVQQFVQAQLHQFLQDRFGDVLPQLQEQARATQLSQAAEMAWKDLEGTEGFKDIRSLDQEQEGQPLVVNGEEYRNTPLNRILAENPWIMSIKRDNADPKVSDRLTYLARLKAAYSIHSKGRISNATAKALVSAGSRQEQRKQQDQVRQSLNKGGTPSRTLDKGGAKPRSYVEELMDSGNDGPISFATL